MTAFKPKSPAMIPTPDSVFKDAIATKSDIIYCVPSFVEVCDIVMIIWIGIYSYCVRRGQKTAIM